MSVCGLRVCVCVWAGGLVGTGGCGCARVCVGVGECARVCMGMLRCERVCEGVHRYALV